MTKSKEDFSEIHYCKEHLIIQSSIETLHENFVMLMQLCIKLTLLIVLHPHYLQHPMIFAIEQVIKVKLINKFVS